jgi:hypothetical protein
LDRIIELVPKGDVRGEVVTPEQVVREKRSYTGA